MHNNANHSLETCAKLARTHASFGWDKRAWVEWNAEQKAAYDDAYNKAMRIGAAA